MKVKIFEKKIDHLGHIKLITGIIDTLCRLLIKKGYISKTELQSGLLKWMERKAFKSTDPTDKNNKKRGKK